MSKVEQRLHDKTSDREREVVDLQPLSREVPNPTFSTRGEK